MTPKLLDGGRHRFVVTVSSEGQELTREETALAVAEKASAPAKSAS